MEEYKLRLSQKMYLPFKYLIDFIGSIFGIIACLIFVWWWVTIINLFVTKGHPFFVTKRTGKNGKLFRMIKFRTMYLDVDPCLPTSKELTKDHTTKFGKFLRVSSIDETLQLFNIFIGQMSFIGPRPLLDVGEDSITIQKRKENGAIKLRPGLSGYAQIHDRIALDPLSKADYDGQYFQRMSFWFDSAVFIYTLLKMFSVVKGR